MGISKFRGSVYVNIREHYEKDGKILPGKKVRGSNSGRLVLVADSIQGISLSIEQFNAMMRILPQLQAQLSKESGTAVAVPDFGTGIGNPNTVIKDEEASGMGKLEKKKKKSKIMGSDEEEEDDD